MQPLKNELDVALVPSDPDKACAFYRDVLGFEQVPGLTFGNGGRQHRFCIGKHLVKLNQMPEPPAREPGGVEAAVGIRLLAFILDGARFEATLARLDAAGHRRSTFAVPDDAPYRVEMTQDPEGSVIELVGLRDPAAVRYADRMQIGLTVADVERSRHFYGQLLGLREEAPIALGDALGTRYAFIWGNTTIKFWSLQRPLPVRTGAMDQHAGVRGITVRVADLDAAHTLLVEKGIPITRPPFELPGVARLLFFADPDGNWIELAQPL